MTERTTIRDADTGETGLLVDLIRRSFEDVARRFSLTPENCPKHPSNCDASRVEADRARGVRYYVLALEGEPAGCVALERKDGDTCYLERLAVLPAYRRQGLGRSLVDHVISQAEAGGARTLGAAIIADQAELKRWYQGMGFVETGTTTFPHLPFEVTFLEYALRDRLRTPEPDAGRGWTNPHP